MSEVQDANDRFNTLWDEIGAKRIVIGEEDKGIEIVVDADLSVFNVIEKLKEAAQDDADKGDPQVKELTADDKKQVKDAMGQAGEMLEKNMPQALRRHLERRLRQQNRM